ncbi:transposase, partial [Succinivibrio sp.]|uniref:transposase n=1 Tax=Succinivibrio sp. TaxID=2053619 RepID=UPI0025F1C76F
FLVDEVNPDAKKVILVMDNLNTHNTASLYKAFPPEEARRIARKLEIHYTPKHGSWLDIAEIGINIMTRECLNRRIPDIETLRAELKAWNEAYNSAPTEINWQFSNETSRIKLKSLYPDIYRNQEIRDQLRQKKSQIK